MTAKQIGSGLIMLLGIIGVFASEISIPSPNLRHGFLAGSLAVVLVALYLFISSFLDIWTAVTNLSRLKRLGIQKIHLDGTSANSPMRYAIRNAKSICIMAVSAGGLIKVLKDDLISALRENAASLRILLAAPGSDFVHDVEEVESPERTGHIQSEIHAVESLLKEYFEEAKRTSSEHSIIGKVYVGYYRTHLRNSIVLWTTRGPISPLTCPQQEQCKVLLSSSDMEKTAS